MPSSAVEMGGADRERLLAFCFANADLLLEVDENLAVAFASGAVHNLTERCERALIGAPFVALFEPLDRRSIQCALKELKPPGRLVSIDTGMATPSGADIPVRLSGYCLDQEPRRYFMTVKRWQRPVDEQARRQRRDKQSGLMCAADFVEAAAAQSAQPGATVTLLELAGLDRLSKRIDAAAFDQVIAEIGGIVSAALPQSGSAARLTPNKIGMVADAAVDLDALREGISELSCEADPAGAGIDVGHWAMPLAEAGLAPEQASQVLRYAIARFAEDGLKDFQPTSMNDVMREMVESTVSRTVTTLRTISQAGVEIAYQRIVDLNGRQTHHWEALSRPVEQASPSSVFQFAEKVGLVCEFDLMVCTKVIAALDQAAAEGHSPVIAINLSANSLENPLFAEAFHRLMAAHASLRNRLMIEITETARITDLTAANNVIQSLRRQGHKVCLDDFGVGSAGFPYVQHLCVDYLKIDGSYIKGAVQNERDVAILRAIVHMCRLLKIGSIAEMVETEAHAALVSEAGVNLGQGFLFGKPSTAEEFSNPRAKAAVGA